MTRGATAALLVVAASILLASADPASGESPPIRVDLGAPLKDRVPQIQREVGDLASGGDQTFMFSLPEVETLSLRVPLEEAPFNGTRLDCLINGKRLIPYFAFGGDTRYDNVKGKPGMRPPLATVEGRWLIPPSLLKRGTNELKLSTTGIAPDETLDKMGPKPAIRIASFRIGPADGGDLPVYANSVYFDFNVWPQGYAWGEDAETRHRYDLALLGVLNGKGMPAVIPALGGPASSLWGLKRACERDALDWGVGHQEFYTIWALAGQPQLWGRYLDVDLNSDTRTEFHDQTVQPNIDKNDPAAKGADVIIYDVAKYAKTLEPAIRYLAAYTDFYNFKCEQHGPWGQGFGDDGERWARLDLHGDTWAGNFYQASKAAHDLVRKYNPRHGYVQEMNHWLPPIRHLLFDTALQRKQPMSDMIDVLMNHFDTLFTYDQDRAGRMTPGETLELQYPGGKFDRVGGTWPDHLVALGYRAVETTQPYPENAIDFNRYRLGRTEADMTLGDPKTNRWGNGQPFDYRAGFRGDEMIYNSENGVYLGYSAPAAYQFVHGFFCYSLLPTGAAEPRDLAITVRTSLTTTRENHVNLYGRWVEGAGHTKRLRTVDPLYGDLFGWTGEEQCTSGDYIKMPGIKDRHHRLPPCDAYGLVRRVCYAFVTAGPVLPALLNPGSSDELFVKCVLQVFDGKRYAGLYAANYDSRPQTLDVTLAIRFAEATEALVFDDRAGDWKDAKRVRIPAGNEYRYRQEIPALGAWLVLIPVDMNDVARALVRPAPPVALSPRPDAAVTDERPAFAWQPVAGATRYRVEIAREALFRPEDRVELSEPVAAPSYTMKATPDKEWRYFWRVGAIDDRGRTGPWSEPRAFVFRWPEYAAAFPPVEGAAPRPRPTPAPAPEWQRLADQHQLETTANLAWQGEIFATGGRMNSPSRAVDSQAFSFWTNGMDEGNSRFAIPADWAVIWPKPTSVSKVTILWLEGNVPKSFAIQAGRDGQEWVDVFHTDSGAGPVTSVEFPPVEAKFLRLHILKSSNENGAVGAREIVVR